MQQCTAQLAIAIQHSELYHHLETQVQKRTADLQQALEFETLLKQITDTVRDSLDEHQILQAAVEELSQGLALDCCEAYLYSADLSTSTLTYKSELCDSAAIGQKLCLLQVNCTINCYKNSSFNSVGVNLIQTNGMLDLRC